ncbi:hypothetical protein CGLO_12361 [Colletotrichum gloeosporioides Cg-14]|uniref:Uncharacterized protein n=1 Tax=Colletotrichum gloeosporioides (strain Cg-14) TaxID=1237896 RepID=T0K8Q5_COLGC|nr:hypothetical protein CGLO_12361 [Colletotrichum gloeosporioides Cg-14]
MSRFVKPYVHCIKT